MTFRFLARACRMELPSTEMRKPVVKSRNTTLSIKVHIVKAIIFPVVMYGRES